MNRTSNVEKFIGYYKWFDDTLTEIISQLVPASSEFVNDVLNVVESHVLERNKYKSKFPTLDFIDDDEYESDSKSYVFESVSQESRFAAQWVKKRVKII